MEFSKLIFKAILLSSAFGSLVAIIIILIKKLFKSKLSATWHYYIWLILILRLVIPYSYESPISIFNIISKPISNVQIPLNTARTNYASENKINESNSNTNLIKTTDTVTNNSITSPASNKKVNKKGTLNLYTIVIIIWFMGMFLAAVFVLILNLISHKKIRNQRICKDKETLDILDSCTKIIKVKSSLPIVYANNINGVSLYGVFKPKILISEKVINKFTSEEKNHIFLHELVHFKYKDIWINWGMLILAIIHWFNPIIWYCFYKMQQDCEIACDEKVLKVLEPNSYHNYSSTIINMAALFSKSSNSFNSTALVSNKINLKRRIGMINLFKRKSWKWSMAGVIIITLIGITCLANPITTVGASNKTQNKTNISGIATESQSNNKNLVSNEVTQTEKLTKDENTKTNSSKQIAKVSSKVKLYEGTYFDDKRFGENMLKSYCEVVISNVTGTSFDFTVYQVIDAEKGEKKVIFSKNTAIFIGDGTKAAFYGKEYTLNFAFPNHHGAYPVVTDMEISGFGPLEGKDYVNNGIPEHEFG